MLKLVECRIERETTNCMVNKNDNKCSNILGTYFTIPFREKNVCLQSPKRKIWSDPSDLISDCILGIQGNKFSY